MDSSVGEFKVCVGCFFSGILLDVDHKNILNWTLNGISHFLFSFHTLEPINSLVSDQFVVTIVGLKIEGKKFILLTSITFKQLAIFTRNGNSTGSDDLPQVFWGESSHCIVFKYTVIEEMSNVLYYCIIPALNMLSSLCITQSFLFRLRMHR